MSNEFTYKNTGQHGWYVQECQPIVWSVYNDPNSWSSEGWTIEEEDGRFEVYYHTNEAMRLSADGMLSVGQPDGYWFNTLEWAKLCVERLKSLDRALGRYAPDFALDSSGNLGIGVTSASSLFYVSSNQNFEPLISIDQSGQVTHFNLPRMFMIWWRNTRVYAAWRILMWGENA